MPYRGGGVHAIALSASLPTGVRFILHALLNLHPFARCLLTTEYVAEYYTSYSIGHNGKLSNMLSDGGNPAPALTLLER